MAKCRDCELKVIWAETPDGKKIPIDPRPSDAGEYTLRPSHPDAPMVATRATPDDRRFKRPLYSNHRKTCAESDYEERQPSWVREEER